MVNRKITFRISTILMVCLLLVLLTSCSIPFIGGDKKDSPKSNTASNKLNSEKSTKTNETALKTQPLEDTWGNKASSSSGTGSGSQKFTMPGSVLNPGQTWIENGSELTLNDVSLVNGKMQGVTFSLTYKNKKGNEIAFEYIPKTSINVMDNLNSIKKIIGYSNDMSYSDSKFEGVKITQLVENNEEANISGTYPCFLGQINIGDANINEVLVTVTNISNIKKAQWKIPIYH